MVEFEKPLRRAALSGRADEGALAPVPLPDGAPNLCRDVTLPGGRTGPARPPADRAELPLLLKQDEGIECPVDDLSHISRGNGVAEQGLGVPQLLMRALADRELEEETLGRSRRRLGSPPFHLPRL